jgi:hypothetical protein
MRVTVQRPPQEYTDLHKADPLEQSDGFDIRRLT